MTTKGRGILNKAMSEAEFLAQVIELARLNGWLVAHFRPARGYWKGQEIWRTPVQADGAGFPDLVLCKPPMLIFAELKRVGKHPTLNQKVWLETLNQLVNVQVFCWTPGDWEEIVAMLTERQFTVGQEEGNNEGPG